MLHFSINTFYTKYLKSTMLTQSMYGSMSLDHPVFIHTAGEEQGELEYD